MHSALLLMIILAGCTRVTTAPHPVIVHYTTSDRAALRAELRAHPDLTQVQRWLNDYIGLRDQVRALDEKERGK